MFRVLRFLFRVLGFRVELNIRNVTGFASFSTVFSVFGSDWSSFFWPYIAGSSTGSGQMLKPGRINTVYQHSRLCQDPSLTPIRHCLLGAGVPDDPGGRLVEWRQVVSLGRAGVLPCFRRSSGDTPGQTGEGMGMEGPALEVLESRCLFWSGMVLVQWSSLCQLSLFVEWSPPASHSV